jgi:hypothetical protein
VAHCGGVLVHMQPVVDQRSNVHAFAEPVAQRHPWEWFCRLCCIASAIEDVGWVAIRLAVHSIYCSLIPRDELHMSTLQLFVFLFIRPDVGLRYKPKLEYFGLPSAYIVGSSTRRATVAPMTLRIALDALSSSRRTGQFAPSVSQLVQDNLPHSVHTVTPFWSSSSTQTHVLTAYGPS